MKKEKETFQIELTMENGEITEIRTLTNDLQVSKPVTSLDQLPGKNKEEIMHSMQHGTMMLMGQNSPGWVIIRTSQGYIMVWR